MSSNFIATAAAINASSQASAAASAARAARSAAEENLETKARFVILPVASFEQVYTGERFLGIFAVSKIKLTGIGKTISIKVTDIANLGTENDDYGATYVVAKLEGRSEVEDDDNCYAEELFIPMSLADVTAILNGEKQYNG
jgi:hypothetical protein